MSLVMKVQCLAPFCEKKKYKRQSRAVGVPPVHGIRVSIDGSSLFFEGGRQIERNF